MAILSSTFLAVALLNLVHWIITRRSGALPLPAGVLGRLLSVWFWGAVVAMYAESMHWMSAQLAMSCFWAWGIARALCAVWVRQFHSRSSLARLDSPSNTA
jgi:hypothetical protein